MNLNLKKIISGVFFLVLIVAARPVGAASTSAETLNAYFFYGDGCPHCAEEEKFLFGSFQEKYPDLKIYTYEIYNNRSNALTLQTVAEKLGVGVDGVPFLVIGDQHFVGYVGGVTSAAIETRVAECYSGGCPDSVASLVGVYSSSVADEPAAIPVEVVPEFMAESSGGNESVSSEKDKKIINLPFFGEVDVLNFSLPLLTVVIGLLDGFNPCAMWTLLFLISLLLGMKDRKKMWILGIAFIVASAAVYFLFMVAWLKLILFLGFITWVRILIGALALGGGGYSLKEYFTNKEAACKVSGNEKKVRTFEKLKAIVHQNSFWLALGGIIILAFVVNLVELVCSAGLPAVYAQVLALNDMPSWRYYLYILGYIFFFMLDDLLVFFIAMVTLEMTGITTKYARASRLIGGLLMLAIGLLLIFRPAWLMFG